jgi:hypothetical protein
MPALVDERRHSKVEANCDTPGHEPGLCGRDCRNDRKCRSQYNHCHYPDPVAADQLYQSSVIAEADKNKIWNDYNHIRQCGQLRDWRTRWEQYFELRTEDFGVQRDAGVLVEHSYEEMQEAVSSISKLLRREANWPTQA